MSFEQVKERPGTIQAVDKYWRSRAQDRLPSRSDIDPADLAFALGSVSLVDVLRDPLRFRFRLIGSNIQARFLVDLRDIYVDQFPEPENAGLFSTVYKGVLNTGQPQDFVGSCVEDGKDRLYRGRIWPLASDGKSIDMLLCCREPPKRKEILTPDTASGWRPRGGVRSA